MLDKKSKQVLKVLNKHCDENSHIHKSESLLPFLPKFDLDTLDEVLWYLADKEFITCQGAEDTIWEICINYEGKNYNEFEWINFKELLFKSVLIPIVVSVATSLILLFINGFI